MHFKHLLCFAGFFLAMTLLSRHNLLNADEAKLYQKDPESCASCHMIKPYVETWKKSAFLDHKHSKAGIGCMDCHSVPVEKQKEHVAKANGRAYDKPLQEREYGNQDCFACHGSYEEISEATKDFIEKGLPRNPHESHYAEMDCNLCHKAHRASVDYCSMCHHPAVDKPGWTSF